MSHSSLGLSRQRSQRNWSFSMAKKPSGTLAPPPVPQRAGTALVCGSCQQPFLPQLWAVGDPGEDSGEIYPGRSST